MHHSHYKRETHQCCHVTACRLKDEKHCSQTLHELFTMTAAEPIIEYFPNWDRHKERSPKIKQDSLKNGRMQLPPSFPPRISHRSVWSGNELGVNEWLVEYTNAQLQEIDAALQHFLCRSSFNTLGSLVLMLRSTEKAARIRWARDISTSDTWALDTRHTS